MSILFIIIIGICISGIIISNAENFYEEFVYEMNNWREEIFREN